MLAKILKNQKIKFLVVGAFNTLFGYVSFAMNYFFFGRIIGYVGSLVTAHLVSATLAYLLFRKFVFVDAEATLKSFLRFHSVYIVPLLSNVLALPILIELFNWNAYLAQAAFSTGWIIASFAIHKRFSFRHIPNQ